MILFDLMREKGIYCYEYVTSLSVLDETSLPPKECFYSELTQEGVSDEEYERAQNIWKTFKMRKLWNYHDLYLIMDILLLADVLTNFRSSCMKNYNIDPFHSFTVPGFAWQAALKMTKVKLELISDKEMYLFLEQGKRGGVCAISKRYAKCNVPGTGNYDPNLPTKYLTYQDMNNLYGYAMVQHLPTGEFKWVKITQEEILNTPDDAEYGYILEVDLEYPVHLHDNAMSYNISPRSTSNWRTGRK